MSHTPHSQRLTPSQLQLQSQGQSDDLVHRINTMSIGNSHPHAQESNTYPTPIRVVTHPNHNHNHGQSPPPQGQQQPFASLHNHNHNLQSAPSPYGHHDHGNHGHASYWPHAQGVPTSASAPGGGTPGAAGHMGLFGVGGVNAPFTSTDNSPVTATFPYASLDGQDSNGHGHGYEGFHGNVYGNGNGIAHGRMTLGQGQGQGYGGIAPTQNARGRDGQDHSQHYGVGRGHQGQHSHGGYTQQDHLESVPGSLMSMASNAIGQYYAYGGEQNFFLPQQAAYVPPRAGRGKMNRGANGHGLGDRQSNRQPYRNERNDYSSPMSMSSLMSPSSVSSHQSMGMGMGIGIGYNAHMSQGAMPIHYGLHPNYQPGIWRGGMNSYTRRENHTPRSPLLDEFRMNKSRRWHLADIQGHMVEFCGDQHGSRFIQQRLESGSEDDRALVLAEIEPNIFALMMDVFGNYVVQKLFEVCDQGQKALLASKMEGNVVKLSLEMYGCRVVQKAFEHVLKDQKDELVEELKGKVIDCVKDNNGNHVIQRLITLDACPEFIPQSFTAHVGELACHPYGCRVLQKTFECLQPPQTRQLLEEMHQEIQKFTNDCFGNYVVQSIITSTTEEDRLRVISAFEGHLQIMARHKFASNVIEKALQYGDPAQRKRMIEELIGEMPDGSCQIPKLLKDAYGNFPVQTALEVAEEPQRSKLLGIITACLTQLKHTPVGKRLEMKLTEIKRGPPQDQMGSNEHHLDGHDHDHGDGIHYADGPIPTATLTESSSPSASDAFSGNDTSFTEDTGLTSPDQGLGASTSTRSKGSGEGVRQISSRSSRRRGVEDDDGIEGLLQ